MSSIDKLTMKLKLSKVEVIKWEKKRLDLEKNELRSIEEQIDSINTKVGRGIFLQSELASLTRLEQEKSSILRISDEKAHLKRRITWLEAGDKTQSFSISMLNIAET